MIETFTVTDQHIKLIKRMCVSWWDCEFGAPSIDCKRPYGNSDVLTDMAEILGFFDDIDPDNEGLIETILDEQLETLLQLHGETQTVLQILIDNLSLSEGEYQRERYGGRWIKI